MTSDFLAKIIVNGSLKRRLSWRGCYIRVRGGKMKGDFIGYYPPSEEDYKRLWQSGLIVLDTNVLLDLYRLPETARDELVAVLDSLKDRLWIPYQVALEFQRRRLTVISAERKATEEALSKAKVLFEQVAESVEALQIEKRGLGLDSGPILSDLRAVNDKLIGAINSVHNSQIDIAITDRIREKLDALLIAKVGAAPANQSEIDSLVESGQDRYDNKIPPGYSDVDKEKNPNEALFFHDGMRYERKFGDLIIWRQILQHTKKASCKSVLLVTADRKEDWWWKEKGKTVGPRPELAREALQLGGVELFWMYSSVQFLEHAKKFIKAKVSDSSVSELKEVVRLASLDAGIGEFKTESHGAEALREALPRRALQTLRSRYDSDGPVIQRAIISWLLGKYTDVNQGDGFPDFFADTGEELHGYDVKYLASAEIIFNFRFRRWIANFKELSEDKVARCSAVVVFDPQYYLKVAGSKDISRIKERCRELIGRYDIYEIIFGFVSDTGRFVEAFSVRHSRLF